MVVLVQGPDVLVAWKDDLRDGTIVRRDPEPKLRLAALAVARWGEDLSDLAFHLGYQRTRSATFCFYY